MSTPETPKPVLKVQKVHKRLLNLRAKAQKRATLHERKCESLRSQLNGLQKKLASLDSANKAAESEFIKAQAKCMVDIMAACSKHSVDPSPYLK